LDCHSVCDNVYCSLTMFSALAAVCTVDCAIEIDLITLHYVTLHYITYYKLNMITVLLPEIRNTAITGDAVAQHCITATSLSYGK